MTTTTKKVFIESKFAEITETTQYTAVNCKAEIDKFTAVNVTGINATLTVKLVKSGDTPSAVHQLPPVTIAPGKSWPFPDAVAQLLEAGGFISTIAGTASAISIRSVGREYT
ncbi:MAG: hypothetical protein V4641_01945 [Pseudomonadota bacterium]